MISLDNAMSESFFGILKSELVYHECFRTRQEAKDKTFDYIDVFYNRNRIHSATIYLAPRSTKRAIKKRR